MATFWATFALILLTLFIVASLVSFFLFFQNPRNFEKSNKKPKEASEQLTPTIKFLLWTALIVIFIGIWMPFILTHNARLTGFDFTTTGAIGDTFGGILNPFIAIAATIVTGLAFYAQYQANLKVNEQFEKQEKQYKLDNFEKLFFEQIRLYKENVFETQIASISQETETYQGRRVFRYWMQEVKVILIFLRYLLTESKHRKEVEFDNLFNFAYFVFYKGLTNIDNISDLELERKFKIKSDIIKIFKTQLKAVVNATNEYTKQFKANPTTANSKFIYLNKEINLPNTDTHLFRTKDQWLSQYFRHIYYTVKFVADNEDLKYEEKRKYLRILRNQISTPEQVLIFYNWYSGYGKSWEQENTFARENKKGNYFFTNYRMIHNINNDDLPKELKLEHIFDKTFTENMLCTENKTVEKDPMFDFQKID